MRITGIEIPDNKRIVIALTYIYGIGSSLSKKILSVANINESARASDLNGDQLNILRNIIADKYIIEGDLRREVTENIKRLREIGSYRGTRHAKKLPAHGQRTKTNSRTIRGNKRLTVGSGRRSATTPT